MPSSIEIFLLSRFAHAWHNPCWAHVAPRTHEPCVPTCTGLFGASHLKDLPTIKLNPYGVSYCFCIHLVQTFNDSTIQRLNDSTIIRASPRTHEPCVPTCLNSTIKRLNNSTITRFHDSTKLLTPNS